MSETKKNQCEPINEVVRVRSKSAITWHMLGPSRNSCFFFLSNTSGSLMITWEGGRGHGVDVAIFFGRRVWSNFRAGFVGKSFPSERGHYP
jgi:hypothetical protein